MCKKLWKRILVGYTLCYFFSFCLKLPIYIKDSKCNSLPHIGIPPCVCLDLCVWVDELHTARNCNTPLTLNWGAYKGKENVYESTQLRRLTQSLGLMTGMVPSWPLGHREPESSRRRSWLHDSPVVLYGMWYLVLRAETVYWVPHGPADLQSAKRHRRYKEQNLWIKSHMNLQPYYSWQVQRFTDWATRAWSVGGSIGYENLGVLKKTTQLKLMKKLN